MYFLKLKDYFELMAKMTKLEKFDGVWKQKFF